MAQESIIIDVQVNTEEVAKRVGEATTKIKMLKDEQKLLTKALEEGRISNENYGKAISANKADLEQMQRVLKSSTAAMQVAGTQTISTSASLDEQRQVLNTLQKAYGQLEGAEKEAADQAGGLRDQIDALSDSVKEQEAAIGDSRRNVGNYGEAIAGAFGDMAKAGEKLSPAIALLRNMGPEGKRAAAALDGLKNVLTLAGKAGNMLATSTKAQTAVTGAQTTATEAQTAAQYGLNTAMAANPVGLIITGISTLLPLIASFCDSTAEAEAAQKRFNDELAKQQRLIAAAQADYELEARIAEAQGKTAEEALRIRLEGAKKVAETAMDNEQAALEAFLNAKKDEKEAAKKHYNEMVKIADEANKEVNRLNQELLINGIKKDTDETNRAIVDSEKRKQAELKHEREQALEDWWQQVQNMRALAEMESATAQAKFEEIQAAANEMLKGIDESEEEEYIPTPEEMVRDKFGLDEQGVAYFMQLYGSGMDFAQAKGEALKDQWGRNATGIMKIISNIGDGLSAMGDIIGGVAEENENAIKVQKAFALVGILTNQAASISEGALAVAEGIRSAAQIPFPYNIPAIISVTATIAGMLAGVASTITQAKQLFSQANDAGKFATGGVVGGSSYTGDKLIAHVNSGEGIYTGKQANAILQQIANNPLSGASETMTETLVAALQAMPAPVMDYTEFKSFEQTVSNITEIAKV